MSFCEIDVAFDFDGASFLADCGGKGEVKLKMKIFDYVPPGTAGTFTSGSCTQIAPAGEVLARHIFSLQVAPTYAKDSRVHQAYDAGEVSTLTCSGTVQGSP